MALITDFLEDVGHKKLGLCLNVYLIRCWEESDKNNEEEINNIDMIIQDIKVIPELLNFESADSYGFLRGKSTVKTIKEVAKSTEECDVWITRTIVAINATKDSWYYVSCKKSVRQNDDNHYDCKECNHIDD
ncbi:hypothetical protein PIB30_044251 [Stylosanthes scabra]|uniref:Uncharacterized protein n=1 Tax=Stylosanthes scabra TaxID=79078 RepID=A0ABU6ZEH8_9FABA|nr:hypothetical protein [Stylosanthes scabra]